MIMHHYHLWTQDRRTDNQYCIEAASEGEARSLVALNHRKGFGTGMSVQF